LHATHCKNRGVTASPPGEFAPIRVWLEPGYDHGRTGCWILDWPGCFTWADTVEAALARVPSAVGGFVDWLLEHGDAAPFPKSGETVVVDQVPATREDGYERNATFEADRRAVTAGELEAILRRLGFARQDLQSLAERVAAFEADRGPLPSAPSDLGRAARPPTADRLGVPEVRTADAVLRHVAGAEVWLTSRLEREARYEGPPQVGDLGDYLRATRAWAVERVRALHRRDPALQGIDGKGETWTLAKVLRRLLYHSLDHLNELDRRLAVADGTVDRLPVLRNAPLDLDDLIRLLMATGFASRARDRERLRRMLEGSTETFTVWDGERLVGFARTLTDGAFNAYVSTVAIHPRWQGRGLGHRLIRTIVEGRDEVHFVLHARVGTESFYRSLGFQPVPALMARPRGR
jgi:ribosomal protein S18 acetylase RimI-like enzyme/predicted RNase H-like HicB family nuclease